MTNEKAQILVPTARILVLQLVCLLIVLAIIPLFEQRAADRSALLAGITVLFGIGLIVNRRYPLILMLGIVLTVLGVPAAWMSFFVDDIRVFVVSCVFGGLFFVMTAVAIMWGVLRWHSATLQSFFGALSAYLLLGLAWAMFYWGLTTFDPMALDVPHRRMLSTEIGGMQLTSFSQMVYFSFVCMSTLGFGDIAPRTQIAEMLAWTQSVVGQFYLAILVARLVGALPNPQNSSAASGIR